MVWTGAHRVKGAGGPSDAAIAVAMCLPPEFLACRSQGDQVTIQRDQNMEPEEDNEVKSPAEKASKKDMNWLEAIMEELKKDSENQPGPSDNSSSSAALLNSLGSGLLSAVRSVCGIPTQFRWSHPELSADARGIVTAQLVCARATVTLEQPDASLCPRVTSLTASHQIRLQGFQKAPRRHWELLGIRTRLPRLAPSLPLKLLCGAELGKVRSRLRLLRPQPARCYLGVPVERESLLWAFLIASVIGYMIGKPFLSPGSELADPLIKKKKILDKLGSNFWVCGIQAWLASKRDLFQLVAEKMNKSTSLPCQDQHFAGGRDYNCPHSTSTSASSVDVSRETWVSFWAAGLLDNREQQQEPQAREQCNDLDFLDFSGEGNQLSSQLYRNKQLQDTLLQKEEELARLHEENNSLRQYLNSALVKCLERRAKKLLMQNGPTQPYGCTENWKRKPREGRYPAMDTPHPKNAKRNLFSEFVACEGQPSPPVDSWVLKTLGLKDLDTIDDSVPANYSAVLCQPERGAFPQFPGEEASYKHGGIVDLPISYERAQVAPLHNTGSQQVVDLPFFSGGPNQPGALQTMSNLSPNLFSPFTSPGYSPDVSPNKTDVAFSTSLTPHCHVKTHSFQQGQAFVRRDEGGWKFTWVPKQS
ncbi:geminin coiled-coil domain-containing protein 1 [Petaurus breviceps papuanus]|uniref:geminin coiled-coil domain-containing protein 1 n=1 Tax=Petaurus breviceps papuanus TaxID=3040969 RepID=UPI0036DAE48E